MSFILDALKKSQEEREQRQPSAGTPSAGLQPVFVAGAAPVHRPVWLWLVVLLLLAVAGLLLLLLLTLRQGGAGTASLSRASEPASADSIPAVSAGSGITLKPQTPPVIVEVRKAEQPQRQATPAESSPVVSVSEPAAAPATSATPAVAAIPQATTPPEPATEPPPSVAEQPEVAATQSPPYQVLKTIPDLVITGHLYSTIAEKSYVTMNGRVWHEGDFIRDQIRISSITRDGLILDAGGWKIAVGRSQGWQALR